MLFRRLKDLFRKPVLRPYLALRVDTDAAATLASATQAAKRILARRQELDRTGLADRPLVVLAGEFHSIPAHYIHHMLVLKELLAAGEKTVFASETPYNSLMQKFFKRAVGKPCSEIQAGAVQRLDADNGGHLSLACNLTDKYPYANYSRFSLHLFLRRHEILFRNVDAAETGFPTSIDNKDPLAVQSMQACQAPVAKYLDPGSSSGIRVRNDHMARRVLEFAENTGARIVFQPCGNDHVAGTFGECEARYSLSALFKAWSVPLVVLPAEASIPPDHGLKEGEIFRIGAPRGVHAAYGSGVAGWIMYPLIGVRVGLCARNSLFINDVIIINNAVTERLYVHALAERTGLGEIIDSPENQRKKAKDAKREAKSRLAAALA